MPYEDIFFWVFGPLALSWMISCLLFARLSMARIEQQIIDDGYPRPCEWDMQGMRMVTYAWILAVPYKWVSSPGFRQIMDPSLIMRYANHGDRIRARIFMALFHPTMLGGLIGFFTLDLHG